MRKHHFDRSKFASLISYSAFQKLDSLCQENQSFPLCAKIQTSKYFGGKGSNLLTSICIKYLNWKGYFAERTSNTGQMRRVKDGTLKYTYSCGTNGTSDIKAIIGGLFVAIEIKYSKDKQSEVQRKYQYEVEKAGGQYLIVRKFDDLLTIL